MNKAQAFATVTVTDPATGDPVDVSMYLHQNGAIFGIDASFLTNGGDFARTDADDDDSDAILLDPFAFSGTCPDEFKVVLAEDAPAEHQPHYDAIATSVPTTNPLHANDVAAKVANALRAMDGKTIADYANDILDETILYVGDSLFEVNPDNSDADSEEASNTTTKPVIFAEVHTDDHRYSVKFDAVKWFTQASDDEILELAKIGWGGDDVADAVAMHEGNFDPTRKKFRNAKISELYAYTLSTKDSRNAVGYECHVDEQDAMAWLRIHRPELQAQIDTNQNQGSW